MKDKIIIAVLLFAISFILEGIASRVLPFDEIVRAALPPKKA